MKMPVCCSNRGNVTYNGGSRADSKKAAGTIWCVVTTGRRARLHVSVFVVKAVDVLPLRGQSRLLQISGWR